ncbi:branched-chain amino acid ABC transporter permease [Neobacillus sp. OS1-32]|jgi:branched-subunit amino acid ABC-type transport system permease component|uniref:branched-chain amino acid ABC transporter permease n=1 Tax=Neobacillus sp. OS1-32 TaxID=3070682 RepID=UPI0027E01F83|nr:branched-chain amino acid ABC transporter permease [Neobacillus sp. OS1-32]WML31251.1 branched-chain amino acid ABC transporter permease [Neobacillus sp. OS1-32]
MIVFIHILNGLALGMLYALTASGLSLIFGFMGVINFAHGAIYMLGAYLALSLIGTFENFWIALIIVPILVGILGVIIERLLLSKIAKRDPLHSILLTFGLALLMENIVRMIWGTSNYTFAAPESLQGIIHVAGQPYPLYRVFVIVFSIVVCGLIYFILYRTRIGIRIRAGMEDSGMASALGLNTMFLGMLVFASGCALAAIAGIVSGPFLSLSPNMGSTIIISAFIVIVIGGMGNFSGAVLSAIVVGFVESLGSIFIPQFATVFVYLLMIIVLITNREGISAVLQRKKQKRKINTQIVSKEG